MNKDQIKGRIEEAKGTVKETAGEVTGKEDLKLKGKLKKATGKMQAGFGDIRNDARQDK